jgi:hypothetical protein
MHDAFCPFTMHLSTTRSLSFVDAFTWNLHTIMSMYQTCTDWTYDWNCTRLHQIKHNRTNIKQTTCTFEHRFTIQKLQLVNQSVSLLDQAHTRVNDQRWPDRAHHSPCYQYIAIQQTSWVCAWLDTQLSSSAITKTPLLKIYGVSVCLIGYTTILK